MATILCVLTGILITGAVFLMLDRNLVKFLFGLMLLSNAANLVLLNAGRLTLNAPAFIGKGAYVAAPGMANPLPQALILTAIVIGFGLLSFALIMAYRAHQEIGSVDMDELSSHTSTYDGVTETTQEGKTS